MSGLDLSGQDLLKGNLGRQTSSVQIWLELILVAQTSVERYLPSMMQHLPRL